MLLTERKDGTVVDNPSQDSRQVIRAGEVVDMGRKVREWYDEEGRLRRKTEHFNFDQKIPSQD